MKFFSLSLWFCLLPCSDGEETDALDWLPGAPEIEDPEEPGWGQLEVCLCWVWSARG